MTTQRIAEVCQARHRRALGLKHVMIGLYGLAPAREVAVEHAQELAVADSVRIDHDEHVSTIQVENAREGPLQRVSFTTARRIRINPTLDLCRASDFFGVVG